MIKLFEQLVEVSVSGINRKQRSINRLFPTFPDRVKKIGQMGGLRLQKMTPDRWDFKIHSGTDKSKWYDAVLKFKDLPELLSNLVKNKRLWTRDKSRVDLRKLAKAVLAKADVQLSCSCPAQKYYGGDYILSLDKYDGKYGDPERRAPNIRNPKQYGIVCKHLQNLLNVLPFYKGTIASWLKKYHSKQIAQLEKEARAEGEEFKAAGAEFGLRKTAAEEEPEIVRPSVQKVAAEEPEVEEPIVEPGDKEVEEPVSEEPEEEKPEPKVGVPVEPDEEEEFKEVPLKTTIYKRRIPKFDREEPEVEEEDEEEPEVKTKADVEYEEKTEEIGDSEQDEKPEPEPEVKPEDIDAEELDTKGTHVEKKPKKKPESAEEEVEECLKGI